MALLLASNLSATDFSKEAEEYRTWVIGQIDLLLKDIENFVVALKKGYVKEAAPNTHC